MQASWSYDVMIITNQVFSKQPLTYCPVESLKALKKSLFPDHFPHSNQYIQAINCTDIDTIKVSVKSAVKCSVNSLFYLEFSKT